MVDQSRLEDLRRRVQKDPASIAFAQLAEELRRARQYQESVDVCRAGLAIHPGYLSARVTLGRALIDLNQLDDAQRQLEEVRESAPENIAAIRGLADIYHGREFVTHSQIESGASLGQARPIADLEPSVVHDRPTDQHRHSGGTDRDYTREVRTLTALDQWLAAIHVARADRRA